MRADGSVANLTEEQAEKLREEIDGGLDPELVEVPAEERERVLAMNRHDRRAWYARRRKKRRREQEATAPRAFRERVRGRRGGR